MGTCITSQGDLVLIVSRAVVAAGEETAFLHVEGMCIFLRDMSFLHGNSSDLLILQGVDIKPLKRDFIFLILPINIIFTVLTSLVCLNIKYNMPSGLNGKH